MQQKKSPSEGNPNFREFKVNLLKGKGAKIASQCCKTLLAVDIWQLYLLTTTLQQNTCCCSYFDVSKYILPLLLPFKHILI